MPPPRPTVADLRWPGRGAVRLAGLGAAHLARPAGTYRRIAASLNSIIIIIKDIYIAQFCLKDWQDIWNCCEGNKLHAIYPNVGRIPHCKNLSRRDAVVINRLRIGHTRLTHLHLLTGEDQPTCQFCSLPSHC